MFDYVNKFFPDGSYRKLAVRFEVNGLNLADQSIDRRTKQELRDGLDATDAFGVIRAIAGGSTYGIDMLRSIAAEGNQVWQKVLQKTGAPFAENWYKAEIKINAKEKEPWTATLPCGEGECGKTVEFEFASKSTRVAWSSEMSSGPSTPSLG